MKKKPESLQIGILRIIDLGFEVNEALKTEASCTLDYNVNFGYNIADNWVEFSIKPIFSNEVGEKLLSGTVLTRFLIKDLKDFSKGEQIEIDNSAMVTMFSMAFTHTRAVLAKNCAGTAFNSYYLPIINPQSMLEKVFPDMKQTEIVENAQ